MDYRPRRHPVARDAALRGPVGRPVPVRLLDASEGGAKLSVQGGFAPGTPVRLETGRLTLPAVVVWAARGEAGLRFDAPLAPAALEELSGKPFRRAGPAGRRWLYGG